MLPDLIYRMFVAVLLVGFATHRGYYTKKLGGSSSDELVALPRRKAGSVTAAAGLIAMLSTLSYMAWPSLVAWAGADLPDWLRLAGVGTAAAGFVLLQWAHGALGQNWSDLPRLLEGQRLTTAGPYAHVRHPIYTAFILILGSILLISANWLVGGAWILMVVSEAASRAAFEEQILLGKFGDTYRSYMARTGRFIPGLARGEQPNE